MRRYFGITLLELLISISLGLILTLVMLRSFMMQAYINHTLADYLFLRENTSLAVQWLTQTIRLAGFAGCKKLSASTSQFFNKDNFIQLIPQGNNTEISIKYMDSALMLGNSPSQLMVVSDCQTIGVLPYSNINFSASKNKMVAPLINKSFFVKENAANRQKIFALYEKTFGDVALEVVPGVDQLHATMILNNLRQPVAVKINLHLTAPYGTTQSLIFIVKLREN